MSQNFASDPFAFLDRMREEQQRIQQQAESLTQSTNLVARGPHVEVEIGATGRLERITLLGGAPLSAMAGEAREAWTELTAAQARHSQEMLAKLGIAMPDLPAATAAALKEER